MSARTASAVAALALVLAPPAAGAWRLLPPAPVVPDEGVTSVWTGREMLLFGRRTTRAKDGAVLTRADVAAAYDPSARTWRRLPAPGPTTSFMGSSSVWTGKEMLVWGQGVREGFDPVTDRWRRIAPLPEPRGGARAVWDGHEVLVVGGAGTSRGGRPAPFATVGFAYDPATNRWRRLAPMPSGREAAAVVWTGKRLLVWGGQA